MFKNNSFEIVTLNKPGIADFARERNLLLKKTKAEWVFFVDRDERIPPALRQEINQIINNSIKSINGYYVKRKNYFLDQYIGMDKIIRLGKKNAGKWRRAVHEVWDVKGRIGELKNPLIHNTADNLDDYVAKINNYSTIHARENYKEGKKSNLFKIIFYPIGKFLITLIQSKNIVFSIMQSFHSFLSWSKQSLASQSPGKQWISQNA